MQDTSGLRRPFRGSPSRSLGRGHPRPVGSQASGQWAEVAVEGRVFAAIPRCVLRAYPGAQCRYLVNRVLEVPYHGTHPRSGGGKG